MALDLIARGLAASARTIALAATSAEGGLPTLAQFADLALRTIPPAAVRIEAGVGAARGSYIADALATPALAAAHPRFCKADAGGRRFRLLADERGLIPVACGGAVGQLGPILDKTVRTAPVLIGTPVDDHAAIQAAEDYRSAIGARGLGFDMPFYAARRQPHTGTNPDIHVDKSGLWFEARGTEWVGTGVTPSTIVRIAANGTVLTQADFQVIGGFVWRGGGVFVGGKGTLGEPSNYAEYSFKLKDVVLDGGLWSTYSHLFPASTTTGDDWDINDKGIWFANDRYVGDLTLEGQSGVIGFRGELLYGAFYSAGGQSEFNKVAKRKWRIGPHVVLGETNGSCINPAGATLEIDNPLCFNAALGIEAVCGDAGWFFKARFVNVTNVGAIQGGVYNISTPGVPGSYFNPTRPNPAVAPIGHAEFHAVNGGSVYLGSWVNLSGSGVDTKLDIFNPAVFVGGGYDSSFDWTSVIDQSNASSAILFVGGERTAGELRCRRTEVAANAGRTFGLAVSAYGAFGDGLEVRLTESDGVNAPIGYSSYTGTPIRFRNLQYNNSWPTNFSCAFDIQTGAPATLPPNPLIGLTCTGSATGTYTLHLPTNVNIGMEIILANFTRNHVNPGVALRIPGTNFRSGRALVLPSDYNTCKVGYDGARWRIIEAPTTTQGSVAYDPPSLALAASGPIQTLTVNGAAPGDKVRAAFSLDLAGAAITAWVSAANTVSYYFTNVNGAAPLNLASGTVSLEVSS